MTLASDFVYRVEITRDQSRTQGHLNVIAYLIHMFKASARCAKRKRENKKVRK